MDRTFVLAAIAAFAVSFVLGFLFHGVVLYADYLALPAVYRGPQLQPGLFGLLLLAQAVAAVAMTAIYRYGREDRPWIAQGARFGLMVAAASVIPGYLIGYVVTNIPGMLALKQIVLETLIVAGMGIAIAFMHRRS